MTTNIPFIADEFRGKRVLVTGGTQGMGKAIVSRLLRGGAKVITTARNIPTNNKETELIFVQADISTAEGCTKVIKETLSRFGGVDILVNVVGGSSAPSGGEPPTTFTDRKSTRLNSSHLVISYAVFCLKKKKKNTQSAPLSYT